MDYSSRHIHLMILPAPTGSGKTVIFELAIIRMLIQSRDYGRESKCIYVAPTKVRPSNASGGIRLISTRPFAPKNIETGLRNSNRLELIVRMRKYLSSLIISWADAVTGCELTGDTVKFGKSAWGEARHATIMWVYAYTRLVYLINIRITE